jgi:endonuclease IV
MKIGATTLPLAGWLADQRKPERSRAQRLAAIRRLVEGYGLSAVELTLDLSMVYPGVFDGGFHSSVADLQKELAFTCTVHLPFLWLDPASFNDLVHQASVDSLCRSIDLTRSLEVHTYVLHVWGPTACMVASACKHDVEPWHSSARSSSRGTYASRI